MRLFLRFFGWIFAGGTIIFLVAVTAVAGLLWHFSQELPDYSQLQDYEPAVMTRVHAADGQLLAEYARERRLYLPIQAVPRLVINAFIAAEDKSFYEHGGLDFSGMARAGLSYVQNYGSGRRAQGASTITQQVAKNFLLTNEYSFARKIKEALLAMKIERAFSKEKILELYLNEIYLGIGAYGVAAASLLYFNKSVHELNLPEAAYLAALPKGPNNYHPFRRRDEAIIRRNYVLDRMVDDKFVTPQQAEEAKKDPLTVTTRSTGAQIAASEYFAEEVRRYINDKYSEKKLYEGGLSVRTTLDPTLQKAARKALTDGFVKYDEAQGYRGALQRIEVTGDWGARLAEIKALADIQPFRLAVVLEVTDQAARIGFQPSREPGGALVKQRDYGSITLDGVRWAKPASGPQRGRVPTRIAQVLEVGDVIYVDADRWPGRAVPAASGARGVGRDGRARPAHRPRVRDGRWLLVRPEPVQPRDPGAAPARLLVQAAGLRRRARQRLYALDRGARRAARDRYRLGRVAAGKLRRQVLRPVDAAVRHRAFAQRHDRAAGAGSRHADDRRIRQAVRHLRQSDALHLVRARRRRNHAAEDDRGLCDVRQWRPQDHADPDRPHPGPLRPHHLPARSARVPGLQLRGVVERTRPSRR